MNEEISKIESLINEDKGCFLMTEFLKIYTETENIDVKLRVLEDLCKYNSLYEH